MAPVASYELSLKLDQALLATSLATSLKTLTPHVWVQDDGDVSYAHRTGVDFASGRYPTICNAYDMHTIITRILPKEINFSNGQGSLFLIMEPIGNMFACSYVTKHYKLDSRNISECDDNPANALARMVLRLSKEGIKL